MTDQKIPERMEHLIVRYLGGNLPETEISELEQWVKSSPEHRESFLAWKKAWLITSLNKKNSSVDLDKDWSALRKELDKKTVVKSIDGVSRRIRWIGVAASLLVLMAAAWWLFFDTSVGIKEVVARNGDLEYEMQDGTIVSLHQGSSIRFLPDLEKERKVVLEGDAFFEVHRDPVRPFRIATQNLQIEVLGTSFYVDARENQPVVQVIVRTGVVSFGKDQDKVLLEAGQTGTYVRATGDLTQNLTTDSNYLSWKSSTLIFDHTPLDQVVFAINRQYGSEVTLENQDLKKCQLTATYQDQTLESVLSILEKTFDLKAVRSDGRVVLSGTGCD